jgi:hypothetical protein
MSINEMNVDYFTTLAESKEWLQKNVRNGVICPCCDRFDKIYNYSLPLSSVKALTRLGKISRMNTDYVAHYTEFNNNKSQTFVKFQYINLVFQPETDEGSTKKTSGNWSITEKGIDFIQGRISIPSHLIIYHNELIGVSETNKYIDDFWSDFNYKEMMDS